MKKKILVVDDDVLIRVKVKNALIKQGYETESATDGEDALEILDHRNFDLILLDLHMPRLSGLQLLEKIRTGLRYKHTPVLCMTADENSNTKETARSLGATGWIQKPLNPGIWDAQLRDILA